MTELTALCRELEQRRVLAEDLDAFFEVHPDIDDQFGAFQAESAKRRSAAARAHTV